MAAQREVARMGTSPEVAHTAASRYLIHSRDQQVVGRRKQPPEPRSLVHKMRRKSQPSRQIHKSWPAAATCSLSYPIREIAAPISSESPTRNFLRGRN